MNPADFGMFWINQYAQAERMVMDDNTSYYAQPSIGMSVLDEISNQTNSLVSYGQGDGPTNRRKFESIFFHFLFNFLRFVILYKIYLLLDWFICTTKIAHTIIQQTHKNNSSSHSDLYEVFSDATIHVYLIFFDRITSCKHSLHVSDHSPMSHSYM